MRFINVVFIELMLLIICPAYPFARPDIGIAKPLEKHLDKLASDNVFSGAVLVARDGKPFFAKAYGMADKSRYIPNRINTKFNIGSMNKMFTAVAIAQLAEQGKLSFDDRVSKHLPDYPNQVIANKVTIHQLLTHTSGMGDYLNEKFYARLDKIQAISDLVPLFADDPLGFQPGEGWEYSNAGFAVLGLIIEKVTGQSYFDYVKMHVFKPAGMSNTDFGDRVKNNGRYAIGYMRVNASGEPDAEAPPRANTSTRPPRGSSAGGAYSTVHDLLKFALALRSYKLLSPKYTEIVTTGKVKVPPGWPMNEYGYGFTISGAGSKRIIGHGGAAPGVAAKLDLYPDLNYTVVILSNYGLSALMPIVMETRKLILKD